ncbi:hypothetical protein [Sphingomonas sp.]|uniref:hypothetical protein n=1 Tax=Sphingomonas sp. TaxID=28214 RepID=UPI003750319B
MVDIIDPQMIVAGTEISMVNTAMDAATIFVDGLKGLATQTHVTKISFFEQILDPDQAASIKGRYILNLTIPNDQFVAIANLLKQASDAFAAKGAFGTDTKPE